MPGLGSPEAASNRARGSPPNQPISEQGRKRRQPTLRPSTAALRLRNDSMRALFVIYLALIALGIVYFSVVGLLHH